MRVLAIASVAAALHSTAATDICAERPDLPKCGASCFNPARAACCGGTVYLHYQWNPETNKTGEQQCCHGPKNTTFVAFDCTFTAARNGTRTGNGTSVGNHTTHGSSSDEWGVIQFPKLSHSEHADVPSESAEDDDDGNADDDGDDDGAEPEDEFTDDVSEDGESEDLEPILIADDPITLHTEILLRVGTTPTLQWDSPVH
uniref:Secreted protein n=1 Tax=Achlya hypogyna TaxID=1202772 RepID=A0A0A7CMZ4_ACHHY|nr:secreted protein [Achlya hypogyna]